MNIDDAANAKADIFRKAFAYAELPVAAADDHETPVYAPAPDSEAEARISRARRERRLAFPEEIAVGILRKRGGDDDRDVKVGVFVQRKRLVDHPIVQAARRIASRELQVVVTGPVRAQSAHRCRPLRIGASVGHHKATAGTIGCFCVCRTTGAIGILSNNHVLARLNAGVSGDPILQPGRIDGGGAGDRVATLGTFIHIDFAPNAPNFIDCAFAPLLQGVDCDAAALDASAAGFGRGIVGEVEDLVVEKDVVRKIGRTTQGTEGEVEAIEVDNLTVQMVSGPQRKYALFHKQIAIGGIARRFSKGGDSGSLVLSAGGRPVALLFAGTGSGGFRGHGITYANPIRPVLDALDVDIYVGMAGA